MSLETVDQHIHKRLGNIQALRGIAALLVVLSHLWVIERKYAGDALLGPWAELGMVGVDIFFVISGFIMVYVTQGQKPKSTFSAEPQTKRSQIGQFLYARITRIYPLYWLISAAVLLVFWIAPELVFSQYDQPAKIIPSFALWPQARDPLLAVGWTLIHEMGFYLVFALLLLLPKRLFGFGLLLWALILIAVIKLGLNFGGSPVLSVLFSPLSLEFIAGCVIGLIFYRLQTPPKWLGTLCCWLGLALWGVTFYLLLSRHGLVGSNINASGLNSAAIQSPMINSPLGRSLHFTLPACLLVFGLAQSAYTLPHSLQKLGDWSYALYLSHVLSLSLMGMVWAGFAKSGTLWDNLLFLPLILGASLITAAVLHTCFERPILRQSKAFQNTVLGAN